LAFEAEWEGTYDTDEASSDSEDEFMESACSKYLCNIPARWVYYGKVDNESGN
jgi:hypothetical protein